MDNSSNPVTANPQNIGGEFESQSTPGIQNTGDIDTLRQQQQRLSVETTGEPANLPQEVFSPSAYTFNYWPIIVIIIVIIGVIVLIKLLYATDNSDEYDSIEEQPVESKPKKSLNKKKSVKKKSAPNQRRKKVSKNKR